MSLLAREARDGKLPLQHWMNICPCHIAASAAQFTVCGEFAPKKGVFICAQKEEALFLRKKTNIKRLALSGLLVAAGVILSGALSIPAFPLGVYSIKIGFGMLPVILSGILLGPVYGGMVGGLTDLLQALLFPRGAYMPWFTVAAVFFGLIPGLYFIKKQKPTLLRLLLAVGSGQVFGSVVCNTLIMVFIYGLPLATILPLRIVNQAIMIPLYAFILYWILPHLKSFSIENASTEKTLHMPSDDYKGQ